jgi:hypothetical protein
VNGYVVEMIEIRGKVRHPMRWIGIASSAAEMIAKLPGGSPSVVDRGQHVLAKARFIGLNLGDVQEHHD